MLRLIRLLILRVAHVRLAGLIEGRNILFFVFYLSLSANAYALTNPIIEENAKPGTDRWQLTKVAEEVNAQIKGYASATSVNKGASITFYVSVRSARLYSIEIYRMGWYGGKGGRLMKSIKSLQGVRQRAPVVNAVTGLIYCPWSASYTLKVPTDWVSGIYFAKLKDAQGYENYITFAVRDDARQASFLYQQPVTTYQAYNLYPDDGVTGKSLYDDFSYGAVTMAGDKRAVRVSFDRPYTYDGAGFFFEWEHDLVSWLEKSGYDVAYSTDIDLHQRGAPMLRRYKAFLSAGHDEYWTKQMYDAAVSARDTGVNLAFFGSNAVYWQIRLVNGRNNVPNRDMISYKDASIDPITDASRKTIQWRELGRPEQTLVGIQYITYNSFEYDGSKNSDYIVRNSQHWVYRNTGFTDGARVPKIVGYEVDGYMASYPRPPNTHYALLSRSPFTDYDGNRVVANSSIYRAPSGAWVFATGTMSWSWALNNPIFANSGIQKTTANILGRFLQ